jgi:soluble lytic murein transglycosylase-like protein
MTAPTYAASSLPAPIKALPLLILAFVIVVGSMTGRAILLTLMTPATAGSAAAPAALVEAGYISPIFTPEVQHWGKQIVGWAATYTLDPNLIATVMQIESCGNPQAVSGSEAQGLFQVMPFHFEAGEAMLDPEINARRGLTYLAEGLARAGDKPGLALAGYNGGHSLIDKFWSEWPAETQRYYYWGSGIYADVKAGGSTSPTLDEWLAAGGASLCERAKAELGIPSSP